MEEYTAISENALIEGTKIEFDVFLKSDVGGELQIYIILPWKSTIQC